MQFIRFHSLRTGSTLSQALRTQQFGYGIPQRGKALRNLFKATRMQFIPYLSPPTGSTSFRALVTRQSWSGMLRLGRSLWNLFKVTKMLFGRCRSLLTERASPRAPVTRQYGCGTLLQGRAPWSPFKDTKVQFTRSLSHPMESTLSRVPTTIVSECGMLKLVSSHCPNFPTLYQMSLDSSVGVDKELRPLDKQGSPALDTSSFIDGDGWLVTPSVSMALPSPRICWIPPESRPCFHGNRTVSVIGRAPQTVLDFSEFEHGERWIHCNVNAY